MRTMIASFLVLCTACGSNNNFSGAGGKRGSHSTKPVTASTAAEDEADTEKSKATSRGLEGLGLADLGPVIDLGALWTGQGFFVEDRSWTSPPGFHFPTFGQTSFTLSPEWGDTIAYIFPTDEPNALGQTKSGIGRASFDAAMNVALHGQVVASAADANYESFPGLWRDDDGTWIMPYERGTLTASEIGLATSSNGIDWTKHAGTFFKADPNNAATRCGIGTPSIYKERGTWYLFFHGFDCHDVQIFLSTAPSLGGPWTPANGGAPVLPTGPDAFTPPGDAPADSGTVGRRGIIKQGDLYYMVYEISEDVNYCVDPNTTTPCPSPHFGYVNWSSAMARSADLVHWDRSPQGVRSMILPPTYKAFGQDGPTFGPGPGGRTFVYYRVLDNSTRRAAIVSYEGAVRGVFQHFVGREPSGADLKHYREVLRTGYLSFDAFVAEIGGTAEAKAKDPNAMNPASWFGEPVARAPAPPETAPAPPETRQWSELIHQLWFPAMGSHLFVSHLEECTNGCNNLGPWFRAMAANPETHDACGVANVKTIYGAAVVNAAGSWIFNLDAWDAGHASLATNGWNTRGPAFNVLCSQEPGTTPLYKFINPTSGDRFFSLVPQLPQGFENIGIIGYVLGANDPLPAAAPVAAAATPNPSAPASPSPAPAPAAGPSPADIAHAALTGIWGGYDIHGFNLYSAGEAEVRNGPYNQAVGIRWSAPLDCNGATGFAGTRIFRYSFHHVGIGHVYDYAAEGQGPPGWNTDGFVFCTLPSDYAGSLPLNKCSGGPYSNRYYFRGGSAGDCPGGYDFNGSIGNVY